MGKGSNIRPRNVSKQQYDDNWDRIFREAVKEDVHAMTVDLQKVYGSVNNPARTGSDQDAE